MNRRVHKVSGVFDLPTQTKYVHASRGRRPSHYVGDDREQAILATAERLLAQRPLGDFSVDDLAKGAGISRPTLYFYFPSKNAVLLSLLDQMNTKARAALKALDGKRSGDPAAVWRARIEAFFEVSGSHRAVAVAGAAAKATNPDVRQLWSMLMQGWISYTTGAIKAERGRGAAPDTVPPEDLALALNMLSERVMAATFTDEEPAIPEERVIDTLLAHLAGQHLPPLTVTPQRTSRGVEGPAHRREHRLGVARSGDEDAPPHHTAVPRGDRQGLRLRELPRVQVKGKKQPLQVCEVLRDEIASRTTDVMRPTARLPQSPGAI